MATSSSLTVFTQFDDLPVVTLPDDRFFVDTYPRTSQEFSAFCDQLKQEANAWQDQETCSVDIVHRWCPSALPCLGCAASSRDRRPVPGTVRHRAFVDSNSKITLSLTRPLRIGPNEWSQVWRGTMNVSSIGSEVLPPVSAVVKIFQQSFFEQPESYAPESGIMFATWLTGAQQARREAWAYSLMQSLQGGEIPWSYGIFKLRLGHGELAFAHVMEFVNGRSCTQISVSDSPQAQVWALASSMASALYKTIQCGVRHGDVRSSNIIIRQDAAHPVIFLDFAFAQPILPDRFSGDLNGLVFTLQAIGMAIPEIKAWFEDGIQRQAPWSELFVHQINTVPLWWSSFEGVVPSAVLEYCSRSIRGWNSPEGDFEDLFPEVEDAI
ncbi:hypothetical protein SCP_0600120 [Sparassis crispa]|uniref:Uncharacterized protein n=1 Tax=Sparassis crispa TaxID=139825 RepID=A0A401GP80_9APHY|nr:hypothetical protein SCP_0600120 [Sparassis crispa]GBE84035.1 hypothetical protein SCP_0600120 [Sparassis crispa]